MENGQIGRQTHGPTTLSIMTLSIMTFSIMILSIKTFYKMTFGIAITRTRHLALWVSVDMLSVAYASVAKSPLCYVSLC